MAKIKLTMGDVVLHVELWDTPTATAILDALPFSSVAQTWGDEVYFDTPVSAPHESEARDVLEPGEVAFWLAGSCIAIPYGPTPVSQGDELRLASPANVCGRAEEKVTTCVQVQPGDPVLVERA